MRLQGSPRGYPGGLPGGTPHTTDTDDEERLCPNVSHVDHNDEKEHVSEGHRVSHVFVVFIFSFFRDSHARCLSHIPLAAQ